MKPAKIGKALVDFLTGGILDKALDKVALDKDTKAQLKADYASGLMEHQGDFWDFVLDHTGKAEDMPKAIQVIRSLIRPLLTVAAFGLLWYAIWLWVYKDTPENFLSALKLVFSVNIITLTFWFGDKVLRESGILAIFTGKKK